MKTNKNKCDSPRIFLTRPSLTYRQTSHARLCFRKHNVLHGISRLFHICHMAQCEPTLLKLTLQRADVPNVLALVELEELDCLIRLKVLPHATSRDKDSNKSRGKSVRKDKERKQLAVAITSKTISFLRVVLLLPLQCTCCNSLMGQFSFLGALQC